MKLTEAKLKQLIREVMTEGEGAKGISDLPDGVYVSIAQDPEDPDGIIISYVNEEGGDPEGQFGFTGFVAITEPQLAAEYPCMNAYAIGLSGASHGYGPLLYDVAMEVATIKGGGLVSDRTSVSKAAQKVWRHYYYNRDSADGEGGDVEVIQLDNERDYLTYPKGSGREPIAFDNCLQNIAYGTITGLNDTFLDSPLSKLYRKQPDKLKALGKKLRISGIDLPGFGNQEDEETEQKDLTN